MRFRRRVPWDSHPAMTAFIESIQSCAYPEQLDHANHRAPPEVVTGPIQTFRACNIKRHQTPIGKHASGLVLVGPVDSVEPRSNSQAGSGAPSINFHFPNMLLP